MKRFAALYFLFLALLFTVFYAPASLLSTWVNSMQTEGTLFALNLFLDPGQLQGIDIMINPHYKIIINQACNGVIPILFLYASIWAYPSSLRHKVLWMAIGYAVYFVTNVLRILLVVQAVELEEGSGNFYWSHDIFGNALLMGVGLLLFVSFIRTASKKVKSR